MSHIELDHVRLADEYERANGIFLAALKFGRVASSHRNLIWRREHPINEGVQQRYEGTFHTKRDETIQALNLRVDRDECFYCGTRKDIGCQHHPLEIAA